MDVNLEIDWARYPHLNEDQQLALKRMASTLGYAAANDLLLSPAEGHAERIAAFVRMEQMYAATAQQALTVSKQRRTAGFRQLNPASLRRSTQPSLPRSTRALSARNALRSLHRDRRISKSL